MVWLQFVKSAKEKKIFSSKAQNQQKKATKICAFEDCNKKFKVLATNNLQKYCCTYCRDKANKFKKMVKKILDLKVNFNNRFRTKIEEKIALNNNKDGVMQN